jgi:ferredoxin--NADP+ reductase
MSEAIMRLDDYDTQERFDATVVSSERITAKNSTEEVRELVLDVEHPALTYEIGQSIGVFAPGNPKFGKKDHFRLYSVADLPEPGEDGRSRIKIAVRRCSYVDRYSGEQYPGVASNYLCDLRPGAKLCVAGPFGLPFVVPEEHDANMILIGTGTGIAPFRAFVKHLYRDVDDWTGRVWLLYGARSGLELLYMNEQLDDFSQYYDEETFKAFQALSPRPNWADPIGWDHAIAERADELSRMMADPSTYVYVAGLEEMRDQLDATFGRLSGGKEKWLRRKAELMAGKRWVELLY